MSLKQHLLSRSAVIFAVRISGAGLVFLLQAIIARIWGRALLGEYFVAIAMANLLAITLPLGFQTIGSYFAADYAAKGQGQSLRRFAVRAYAYIVFPGFLILLLAGLFVDRWGASGARLSEMWLPVSVLAAGTAMIYVNGAILIGLKRPYAGFFADSIFRPLIIAAAFIITSTLMNGGDKIVTMLWWLASAYLVVALVHFWVSLRAVRAVPTTVPVPSGEWRRWWHFAPPWLIISLATDFFFDIDLLLLTGLLGNEQIAVFGVAARIYLLASFGLTATYAVLVPGLMEDEARNDLQGLTKKIGEANMVAAGFSLLVLVSVLIVGRYFLMLFGDGFVVGAMPLAIICASLIARSVFGPTSLILSVRNYPYANLPGIVLGLLILVGGNLFLVPQFGLVGAASAAFISILVASFAMWVLALKLTGMDVSIFPSLKNLLRPTNR